MRLVGELEDRSTWVTHGRCPIEKAMNVVGSRNAMLVMREAFYGTTRYDDFAERVGMSTATTASNLKALVDAGLLLKRPYKDARRTRDEYVLTPAGEDLMPVVFGLFEWGAKHASDGTRLEMGHRECGEPVTVEMVCAKDHVVAHEDVDMRVRARRN